MAADGTVTGGTQVSVGGLTVIDVPSREEAHQWAAKWASTCRCDQRSGNSSLDPAIDAMLREAANRRQRLGNA